MITDKMMPEWGRAESSEEGGGKEKEREKEKEGETRLNFKPQRAKLQTSNSKLQTPIVLLKTPNPKPQTPNYPLSWGPPLCNNLQAELSHKKHHQALHVKAGWKRF